MDGNRCTRSASVLACAALLGLSHAFLAAALDRDDLSAAREAYAKAARSKERQTAALQLGFVLLQRALDRPAASQQPPLPDQPSWSAAAELTEAEQLFREAAAGSAGQADQGEAGVIATLLVRGGPAATTEVTGEIQRLQQSGRGADGLLCLAMRDLVRGRPRDSMLAASDLVNDHVHAFLPAAPYLYSARISKPERLSAPQPEYPEQARRAKLRGHIVFEAIIDGQGHVANLLVRDPAPLLLAEAAAAAFRQWTYRPALLDGKPVPFCVETVISFDVQ